MIMLRQTRCSATTWMWQWYHTSWLLIVLNHLPHHIHSCLMHIAACSVWACNVFSQCAVMWQLSKMKATFKSQANRFTHGVFFASFIYKNINLKVILAYLLFWLLYKCYSPSLNTHRVRLYNYDLILSYTVTISTLHL